MTEHSYKLTDQALRIILSALADAPWRLVNPVILDLQRQRQQESPGSDGAGKEPKP